MTQPATAEPTTDAAMQERFEPYGDAWAIRDASAIAALHADDGIFHLHAGSEAVQGREAIEATFAAVFVQWPDLTFAEQASHLGDWGWVVRWRMSGTLATAGEDADGTRAGAGARFEVDAVDVIEVSGGLLTAKHTYVDSQTLLQQLGAAV